VYIQIFANADLLYAHVEFRGCTRDYAFAIAHVIIHVLAYMDLQLVVKVDLRFLYTCLHTWIVLETALGTGSYQT
jgi:hypothetical protein